MFFTAFNSTRLVWHSGWCTKDSQTISHPATDQTQPCSASVGLFYCVPSDHAQARADESFAGSGQHSFACPPPPLEKKIEKSNMIESCVIHPHIGLHATPIFCLAPN